MTSKQVKQLLAQNGNKPILPGTKEMSALIAAASSKKVRNKR